MPPLRERRDDIPELVRHFIPILEEGLPWKMVDEPALNRLQATAGQETAGIENLVVD